MQADDELQTTLSKWPFFVGDLLLVAIALAIAILGGWQLSGLQVAACVTAVALGAVLLVIPYLVEFRVRVDEEKEEKTADLRFLQRELTAVREQGEALAGRLDACEQGLAAAQAAPHALREEFAAESKRVAELRTEWEAACARLRAEQERQSTALESIEAQRGEQDRGLDRLQSRMEATASENALQKLAEELSAFRAEIEGVLAKAQPEAQPKTQIEAQPKAAGDESAQSPAAGDRTLAASRTVKAERPARKRRKSEPRLLKRAIEEGRDHRSAAVNRIIGPKAEAGAEPAAVPEASESKKAVKAAELESESGPELETAADAVPADPASSRDAVDELPAAPAKEGEGIEEAQPLPGGEDMFAQTTGPSPHRRTRRKKSDTALLAKVFIGIGNKPYVRGEGAGLNWESGQPMEFEEIGLWRWIAPEPLDESHGGSGETSIRLQVYRNDEEPDKGGIVTLKPGQQLQIEPIFD
jgi:hypothetical protein